MRFSYQINEPKLEFLLKRIWTAESGALDHINPQTIMAEMEGKDFHAFKPYGNCTITIARQRETVHGYSTCFASVIWRKPDTHE